MGDIVGDGELVVAQIQQVDLREVGGEEGHQGVGVGVPYQQDLPPLGLGILDDAQGLVPAQEQGIFILALQPLHVVELPCLLFAGPPGRNFEILSRHI